jgi:hypothetical protein
MDSQQIIYPTERLLANPRIFMAIANEFDGPDWETFRDAFYDLIEAEFDDQEVEPLFEVPEVCFRIKPDDEEVFQVILTNGQAIELRPSEDGEAYQVIQSEEELGVASVIYRRLVKAIEEKRPDLAGDISLNDVPMINNGFLRDEDGDAFRGTFSLLSDPESRFGFVVNVVNLDDDKLEAEVTKLL